jgi:diguanylate cyclase (GGDEF)-like protein
MKHRVSLSESPRMAARFAAAVLFVGGVAGLLSDHLAVHATGWSDALAVFGIALSGLIWVLPWDRWPRRSTLSLAVIGLVMIGTSRALGADPTASFVASFVMVFMWVGVTQPPNTSLVLVGPAVLSYVVSTLVAPHYDGTALQSLGIVVPVLVLSAEVPARMVAELRRARAAEHEFALRCADDARTDELTRLGNRRFGERLLSTVMPGDAIVLLDCDHFKGVNDRFGHAGGDRVLRELGEFLRTAVRDQDTIARWGGDEFLVVLRHTTQRAGEAAERLVQGWRALEPIASVSIGVAVHAEDRSVADTYSQADTALYRAKARGRDQVCVFGTDGDPIVTRPLESA